MEPTNLTLEVLREIRDQIAGVNGRVDGLADKLDRTNDRLDQTNDRLDQTIARLDRTNDRLDTVIHEQIRQSTAMVDLVGIVGKLSDRVDGMAGSMDRLSDRIDHVIIGPMGDAVRTYGVRLTRIENHLGLSPEA